MKRRQVVVVIAIVVVIAFITAITMNKKDANKKYTYEEFQAMSSKELFDLFVDHGMRVHEDFKSVDEEVLTDIFKKQFDIMITGYSTGSHIGYAEMAEDAKRIYEDISK